MNGTDNLTDLDRLIRHDDRADEYTLRVLCGEAAALLERIGHAHSSAGNSIYLRLRLATLGHDSRATADPRDAGQERKNG